jgi:hypothetical protein
LIPEWTRTIPPAGSVPLKFWIFAPAPRRVGQVPEPDAVERDVLPVVVVEVDRLAASCAELSPLWARRSLPVGFGARPHLCYAKFFDSYPDARYPSPICRVEQASRRP